MHTYKHDKDGDTWVVGYYTTDSYSDGGSRLIWNALKNFHNEAEAAAYASYLNGGDHPRKPF